MKKTTHEIENELKHVKTHTELKQFMEENLSGQLRFGDWFLELCKKKGVKHADLLNRVAVSKSQLYAVINGTRNPSKELVIKLALALKLTIDETNIFAGRISGKQLFKNLANTTSTVAGKVTDTVVGSFVEDDADEMVKIIESVFAELALDYLLNQKEAEKITDRLRDNLDGKTLKEMFSSSDRKEFARKLLVPLIENEVSKRKRVAIPNMAQFSGSLKEILEEMQEQV